MHLLETRSLAKTVFVACVSLAAGCGGVRDGQPGGSGGSGSGSDDNGGGAGAGEDFRSCEAVDILFVIDNSPSMAPYQQALAQAFPGFVDAIYDKLPMGTDVHVGITTTSFYTGACSEYTLNCGSAETQADINAHYITPTMGTTPTNGEQGRLFQYAGKYYFAADTMDPDRAPLKQWFSAAAVAAGETGCSFEMSSAAAGYAAHPANAMTNAGFIRDDDAVLVVIFLTDEPDKSPEGSAAYHDMLVQAKQACGGDACIIAAGIIDTCVMGVNNTVWQTLNSFNKTPIIGGIQDMANYNRVVGDALASVVTEVCNDIVLL